SSRPTWSRPCPRSRQPTFPCRIRIRRTTPTHPTTPARPSQTGSVGCSVAASGSGSGSRSDRLLRLPPEPGPPTPHGSGRPVVIGSERWPQWQLLAVSEGLVLGRLVEPPTGIGRHRTPRHNT